MNVKPVLEVIETPLERTFRVYAHDYPFTYSGWHHHPEYELHLIRRSSRTFLRRHLCRRVLSGQPGDDGSKPAAHVGFGQP